MKLPRSELVLSLSLSLSSSVTLASTWVLRPAPNAAPGTTATALLPEQFQGDRFCNQARCVLVVETPTDAAVVAALQSDLRAHLSFLPDAHKIFFAKSTFDIETGTFEKDFPGSTDVSPTSPTGLFAVVFKSYPEASWLDDLRRAGLSVLEPLPPFAYETYGSRAALGEFALRNSYVYRVAEIPSGVRRFGFGDAVSPDSDSAMTTTVVAVTDMAPLVKERLMALTGTRPSDVYSTGAHLALGSDLTIEQAIALSRMPEVVSVTRRVNRGAPSDERFNKIVAGAWQSPGTAWPTGTSLGTNSGPPYYWNGYQSYLQSIGIDPTREKIGFLDTGIDDALFDHTDGHAVCPPHLGSVGNCALVFVTDVSTDFNLVYVPPPIDKYLPTLRGDDRNEHGSISTAIAAGIHTGNPGRDSHGWSFTQGVAPGARVALSRMFPRCSPSDVVTRHAFNNLPLWDGGINGLKYSLVELGRTAVLPDFPENPNQVGPGVRLFNHSWNHYYASGGEDPSKYGAEAILLDQATRSLYSAQIAFEQEGEGFIYCGDNAPSLHVVSAGNYPGPWGDYAPESARMVVEPANAKNVIAVGATSGLNEETYSVGADCAPNQLSHAVDDHYIEDFSRFGYPNLRLKPDLVAPGTRAYGRRSSRVLLPPEQGYSCQPSCNFDLLQDGQFAWYWGTSFAAPVVTGSAALVHDWYRILTGNPNANASPALVKATLIASAKNLRDSILPMRLTKVFQGSGYDDLTAQATQTLNLEDTFTIVIDGTGTPNTFMWKLNGGSWTHGIGITGGAQVLSSGFEITFAHTTGHFQNASWAVTYTCAEIKPAPDKYQGWGGVSLDRLFRNSSHYYSYDQGTVFTPTSGPWTKTLTITDNSEPVSVALVWTDRASATTVNTLLNLVNDLNLVVHMGNSFFVGNNYYVNRCDASRDGYSRLLSTGISYEYDYKNNVERVDINPTNIGSATQVTLEVNVESIVGDGIAPNCVSGSCQLRQDFAVFVVNAHE